MRTLITTIFLTFALCARADDQLPQPPAGFAWQRLPAIKSVVLKPVGWFYKETKKGTTDGFFISKEDIDKSGALRTGLTVNCIRDIPKKMKLQPSAYAAAFADAAAAKHKLSERSSFQQGPFRAVKFRFVDAPTDKESITIHQLLIANDKTGTLFLLIFEAPSENWTESWKIGEVILKKLLLDDEV